MQEFDPQKPWRIGELAGISGKTPRTLHFYEEMGLLTPLNRTQGGFRLYGAEAIVRIHWIDRLQALGFTLPQIRDFLNHLHDEPTAAMAMSELREFCEKKLAETTDSISRLQAMERELQDCIRYLDDCNGCTRTEDLSACRGCTDLRAGGSPPPLVAGAYPTASPLTETQG